ncbi:UNVERIFIED_CONTAM: hypothetical protein NCL1_46215 [Trichonephila clavipes]
MNHAHDQLCLLSRKLENTCQFDLPKLTVSFKVLSHWWLDFDVAGSTFRSVRTQRCSHVTDLNSVNQKLTRPTCSSRAATHLTWQPSTPKETGAPSSAVCPPTLERESYLMTAGLYCT